MFNNMHFVGIQRSLLEAARLDTDHLPTATRAARHRSCTTRVNVDVDVDIGPPRGDAVHISAV